VIGGVCGGMAAHLKVDPAIVRIGWIVLSIATKFGLGIIIYILCLIVIKEEPLVTSAETTKIVPPKPVLSKQPKRVKKMPDITDTDQRSDLT
jgi:phage shock protein C